LRSMCLALFAWGASLKMWAASNSKSNKITILLVLSKQIMAKIKKRRSFSTPRFLLDRRRERGLATCRLRVACLKRKWLRVRVVLAYYPGKKETDGCTKVLGSFCFPSRKVMASERRLLGRDVKYFVLSRGSHERWRLLQCCRLPSVRAVYFATILCFDWYFLVCLLGHLI
jgi:hypothetical protein